MYSIENAIEIQATPARLLQALTTKQGIAGWWTDDADVNASEATYRFRRPESPMAVTFAVERADETGVALRCTNQVGNPDWQNTRLEFRLRPTASGTQVALLHSGFPARNEVYDSCVKGWAHFLSSLQSYLQTGVGTPYANACPS